jgi:hypothetical protein
VGSTRYAPKRRWPPATGHQNGTDPATSDELPHRLEAATLLIRHDIAQGGPGQRLRLLDRVETATLQLDSADLAEARARRVHALGALSEHLLEHLDREEEVLGLVFLTWGQWPSE